MKKYIDSHLFQLLLSVIFLLCLISFIYLPSIVLPISKVSTAKVIIFPIIALIISIIFLYALLVINKQRLKKYHVEYIFIAIIMVLFIILALSPATNGVRRWINLGLFNIQPSEVIKPLIILIMAKCISTNDKRTKLISYLSVFFSIGIIFIFKSNTSSIQIFLIMILMTFFLENDKEFLKIIFTFSIISFVGGTFALILKKSYGVSRIKHFITGLSNPQGQVGEAIIALKKGGLFGAGVGNGTQKYFYLPEAHNDYIFASIAEEGGFITSIIIIILFTLLIYTMFRIAYLIKGYYSKCLAFGVGFAITNQIILHIGINLNILPSTGITLPFIGYGGSASISNFMCIAVLVFSMYGERLGEK